MRGLNDRSVDSTQQSSTNAEVNGQTVHYLRAKASPPRCMGRTGAR
jgi:hypothetical protein